MLKAIDWLARKITWDGKGVGNYRHFRLPLIGHVGFDHRRHPTKYHFPGNRPCWRPWHVRIYSSLADRWLRWRFQRCTICGSSFSWWETGARNWVREAQSGSRWHRLCIIERWMTSELKKTREAG